MNFVFIFFAWVYLALGNVSSSLVKVFTYNLTDDHVDKLKFGLAEDSGLTFDFTGLFGQQESPRQSQPKVIQRPQKPNVKKNRPKRPKNRPTKKNKPKKKQDKPTQSSQNKEANNPNSTQLPRKPKAQGINEQNLIQQSLGVKPPRPPGPPPSRNNIPVPSPVIKGLGNPPIRFGFGPSPLSFGPSQRPISFGPSRAPQGPSSAPLQFRGSPTPTPSTFGFGSLQVTTPSGSQPGPSSRPAGQSPSPFGFGSTAPPNFGPSNPPRFGPSTPFSFGPSTPQSFGPSTPQSFGPSTPKGFGPSTPLSFGPPTPQSFSGALPNQAIANPETPRASLGISSPQSIGASGLSEPKGPVPFNPQLPASTFELSTPASFDSSTPLVFGPAFGLSQPGPTASPGTTHSTRPPFVASTLASLLFNPDSSPAVTTPAPFVEFGRSTQPSVGLVSNQSPQTFVGQDPEGGSQGNFGGLQPAFASDFNRIPTAFGTVAPNRGQLPSFGFGQTTAPQEERRTKSQSLRPAFNSNQYFTFLREQIKAVKNTMPANFGLTHPQISVSPTFMKKEKSQPFVFGNPPTAATEGPQIQVKPVSPVTQGPRSKNPARFRQTTRKPEKAFQSFQLIEKDVTTIAPLEEFPLSSDAPVNLDTQDIKIVIEGEQDKSRGSSQVNS